MSLSKAQMLYEIGKCLSDPVYAIESYLETEDRTQKGFVPFKLFPRQKELVTAYKKHDHNIVMKPRQAGISTTTAAYLAILTALASNKSTQKILIAANKQETAKEFLKKIRDFTMQLPAWMDVYRPPNSTSWFDDSKNSNSHYKLWNGSEVKAVASSKDALRGYTPSYIVVDEAAFIEGNRGEEFYTAAQPSLSTGGKSILISCVTDDTFVLTPKGIREVSDFVEYDKEGGYYTKEYEVFGYGKSRKSNIFHNNGFVDTKIIETKYSKLEGSNNHKLYAYSEKDNRFGWYKLEELNVNDYVPIVYGHDVWGDNDDCYDFTPIENTRNKNKFNPSVITEDISYFMGLFLAEGSTYKFIKNGKHYGTSITISCGDDVSHVFDKLGLNYSYDGKWHYTTGSKELGEFLEYIGFDLSKKAKEKIIPKRIFELSRNNVIAFIKGFMDGDGYSRQDNGRVGLCSSSKRLVEQFRMLFMNFGILCEYQEILMKPNKKVRVESMNYRLNMTTRNSKKYYDIIGFDFKRKQIKKENLITIKLRNSHDVIPMGVEVIKESYRKNKKGLKFFKDNGCNISHITKSKNKVKHISRELMLSFLDLVNEEHGLIKDNITWVKIKSITNSKNETYDFSLPDSEEDFWCHSVLYNGILGHQTPNGMDPLYHKAYVMAEQGKNNFNIISMKWYEDPRYNGRNDGSGMSWVLRDEKTDDVVEEIVDPKSGFGEDAIVPESKWVEMIEKGYQPRSKWFDDMCAQLNHNARSIAQELLCAFNGSGDSVIDDKHKNRQEKENVRDPLRKEWIDGNMWIWEDPIEGHQYILSADPSSGSSDDSAGICIWDFTTGNQVAEYHGKVAPDVLGEICNYYGQSYNAFIVVDITGGWGASVVLKLIELGYPKKNMYHDVAIGIDALENNRALQKHMDKGKLPGLNFQKNRNTIVSKLEESIRLDSFKIRSKRALNEIGTFVYINGRPDHMKGYHDDLLMSIAMCCFVGMTSFKDLEKSKGQAKAMVSGWAYTTSTVEEIDSINEVVNIGFYLDGGENKNKQTIEKTQEYMWMFSGLPGFKKK
jgi:hypothetical protein